MRFDVAAILFDIDGTLVDSTGAVERTWRSWAARRGFDAEDILRTAHGRRSEDSIGELLTDADVPAAVREVEELELADLDGVVALPAVASLLPALPAGRWAAVTSGSRTLMRTRLTAAGLPVPEVLVAAEDVRAGKPNPEGYLRAAAALGFDATRCLVIEDAPAGIAAGRAAGAAVLGVATSHDVEQLAGADAIVPDLRACTVEVQDEGLRVTVTSDVSG